MPEFGLEEIVFGKMICSDSQSSDPGVKTRPEEEMCSGEWGAKAWLPLSSLVLSVAVFSCSFF